MNTTASSTKTLIGATSNTEQTNVATEEARAVAAYKITHGYEPSFTKLYWCVANALGIHEALIVQIIEGWCASNARENKRGYFHDDQWWTTMTYSTWLADYPALGTLQSIKKRILQMEKAGYIFSCQPDKTKGSNAKCYRVNASKIGALILKASSVVTFSNDANYTERPIVTKSNGLVTNSHPIVTNSHQPPPQNPSPESVSASLLDYSNIYTQSITASAGEKESKNLEEERSEAIYFNPIPVVKKSKDGGNNDKTSHEDRLCGAARENDSQISELAVRENDSQISGFSDNPIKEPDFLSYYRSYQKTQGKEIKKGAE